VSFDSRRSIHQFADILVIGAGIAGIRAALEIPSGLDVLVITKDSLRESNSSYAQGGIAGVLSPEDCFEDHIHDTLGRRFISDSRERCCRPSTVAVQPARP
jgi:L-aspartate oxidase